MPGSAVRWDVSSADGRDVLGCGRIASERRATVATDAAACIVASAKIERWCRAPMGWSMAACVPVSMSQFGRNRTSNGSDKRACRLLVRQRCRSSRTRGQTNFASRRLLALCPPGSRCRATPAPERPRECTGFGVAKQCRDVSDSSDRCPVASAGRPRSFPLQPSPIKLMPYSLRRRCSVRRWIENSEAMWSASARSVSKAARSTPRTWSTNESG